MLAQVRFFYYNIIQTMKQSEVAGMKTGPKPWITIHMAHTAELANSAKELLESEGFLVNLRPLAHNIAQGESCYEIMVLKSEATEARELLLERGF